MITLNGFAVLIALKMKNKTLSLAPTAAVSHALAWIQRMAGRIVWQKTV